MTSHGGRVGPMLAELKFSRQETAEGSCRLSRCSDRSSRIAAVRTPQVRVIRADSHPSILGFCAVVVLVVPAIQAENTRMVVLLPVFPFLLLVVAVVEMARRWMVPCLLQLMVTLVV